MTIWRYEIKHGPEGEANYAWIYKGDLFVATMRTHHAVEIVKALSASPAGVVKPLEWRTFCSRSGNCEAKTALGEYVLQFEGLGFDASWMLYLPHNDYSTGVCYDTLDAAKSAAFADYSARIMSAIEPAGVGVETPPPQTHVAGDAIRILQEGIDGAEADMQSDADAGERVDLFDYEISLPYETAREIAALLRAAPLLPNLSGWRDINTAPVGQSVIICTWWKHSPSSAFRAEGYFDRDTKTWRNQDGSPISEDRTQPTHWMHIPEGPNATPAPQTRASVPASLKGDEQ